MGPSLAFSMSESDDAGGIRAWPGTLARWLFGSAQFGLMFPVPLNPRGEVVLGCQEVRLIIVATLVSQDEVMSQVVGISRPRNEVVYLRLLRQRHLTVEADANGTRNCHIAVFSKRLRA